MEWCLIFFNAVIVLVTADFPHPLRVDLFVNNEGGFPCYRQPLLLSAGNVLLGMAEGRDLNFSQCAPPLSDHSFREGGGAWGLVLRRSIDFGVTWMPSSIVYAGAIDFYTAVYDSDTQIVWLMVQQQALTLVFTSLDFGEHWTSPVSLKVLIPSGFSISPAVGHGIQIESSLCHGPCLFSSRLLVPFVCKNASVPSNDTSCPGCHACVLFSDDHGSTWVFGGFGQMGTRESQYVQIFNMSDDNPHVYAIERNVGYTVRLFLCLIVIMIYLCNNRKQMCVFFSLPSLVVILFY